nr:putative late blight resistance protein homolog R1A-10 [Ipomoea trifida]
MREESISIEEELHDDELGFDRAIEQSAAEGSGTARERGLMGRRGLWMRAAFDPLTAEAGALRDLEIQIQDFSLKAEEDTKIQLSNTLLAEFDIEIQLSKRENAFDKLHQTLQEAAENAADLLSESCVSEGEKASVALTILIK